MAQWKETLEPYVKVQESVKTASQSVSTGEDLIVGVALISDAGPGTPTLISGQKEFLKVFASKDVNEDYINSLGKFYPEDETLAPSLWCNAYRLAGSNKLLVCRATKANDMYFAKPMSQTDNSTYVVRDGELLRRVPSFKIVAGVKDEYANGDTANGWLISVSNVGILGSMVDDYGAEYDYFVGNLPDLVDQLNETSMFFSPDFTYFDENGEEVKGLTKDSSNAEKSVVVSVLFKEVYLAPEFLDKTVTTPGSNQVLSSGLYGLLVVEPEVTMEDIDGINSLKDLNSPIYSGYEPTKWYATNQYNSSSNVRVRIRRFNHDAVISKTIESLSNLTENGSNESPFEVLTNVLDTYTTMRNRKSDTILNRDFFEIAVLDPTVSSEVEFFNVGNIPGRGDVSVSDVNESLNMIGLYLPDDLHDLNLNYYGYDSDDYSWQVDEVIPVYIVDDSEITTVNYASFVNNNDSEGYTYYYYPTTNEVLTMSASGTQFDVDNTFKSVTKESEMDKLSDHTSSVFIKGNIEINGKEGRITVYRWKKNGEFQIYANLTVDSDETAILNISSSDLKRAIDDIAKDEVYVTEGLCDLGNTDLSFQNYLANLAINENYFYPISSINSTNYMTIANKSSKISQNSGKLYMLAPWDKDSGTLGWTFYVSPSVLYWEAVAKNKRNDEEFRSILGQGGGVIQYQDPVTEFNKTKRQLLLTKRINTCTWDPQIRAWVANDNVTREVGDNVLADESNSRLAIRIAKNIPNVLKRFIGRKINDKTCKEVESALDTWFRTDIIPMGYTVEAYICECTYDEELARQNKIRVNVKTRYPRTSKYIEVYSQLYDTGMDFND